MIFLHFNILSANLRGEKGGTFIDVRGGGIRGTSSLSWKFSGQTLLSGQAQVAQKSWM